MHFSYCIFSLFLYVRNVLFSIKFYEKNLSVMYSFREFYFCLSCLIWCDLSISSCRDPKICTFMWIFCSLCCFDAYEVIPRYRRWADQTGSNELVMSICCMAGWKTSLVRSWSGFCRRHLSASIWLFGLWCVWKTPCKCRCLIRTFWNGHQSISIWKTWSDSLETSPLRTGCIGTGKSCHPLGWYLYWSAVWWRKSQHACVYPGTISFRTERKK